ncbi:Etp1p NDAI_0B01820 [Naumovozyma dairenensis CBS 421]|uniref:RING-type domain-containing protein n=1 Tax=Naumovozyma dairenensis (strain ATCC 10597 / BCRC 20456 / CBS 421 / NBRC 0211 / NRRL Y-12639) TaxID=1071378 RepID=G0W605_NAUDC|nr:hypothetical protein NDAI_0B01820 [Naumovozyma dairenensis CBS 421]CCD23216.1 hypothetical protein NDAI_0B01820 [Naumovozyma dairenensis CBS 421]
MVIKYRIVVELENREQVNSAYTLFTTSQRDKFKSTVAVQKLNQQEEEKGQKIDWRLSDWIIETEMFSFDQNQKNKMIVNSNKKRIDQQDKGLLLSEYLGHGIVRLFKLTGGLDVDGTKGKPPQEDGKARSETDVLTIPGDDTMVCILFVPTYFTVHDLLYFYIGDEIVNQISHFRILRNKQGGVGFNFMVLMKFREPLMAKNFKDKFNGKSFSKMDPETCHVIFIKEIVFKSKLFRRVDLQELPYLMTDPFTNKDSPTTLKKVELPTCPVCLERMDSETTGLITIPCQHTFHCSCLDKWNDSRCPVCRYSNLRLTRESLVKQAGDSNAPCATCGSHDNLWICLICGNIGCGRYNFKHAIKHYETTSHCFAMDIATQRVWDYAGDNYVHRLVQNEVDGKLVEVSSTSMGTSNSDGHDNVTNEGKESKDYNLAANFLRNKEYHLEYVQVLISQLESQREYYELKLEDAKNDSSVVEEKNRVELKMVEMQAQISNIEKKYETNIDKMRKQLDIDGLMIKGLQENLDKLTKINETTTEEKKMLLLEKQDLEEQVKDLMFYLESQEKFKDADESVREGTIVIQQQQVGSTNSQIPLTRNNKKKKKTRNLRNKWNWRSWTNLYLLLHMFKN